jgi:hypothetical protein
VDALWIVVNSLWTDLWGAVDRPVGDAPGTLAGCSLTSKNDRAHGVDGKNQSGLLSPFEERK